MGGGGLPIARILGIEIRVSFAWAVLIALITVIGAQQATIGSPEISPVAQWVIGFAVALLFLVSVIAHELAHALVGRRRGVPTTVILLGFIGGLAPLAIQAPRARDELVIALAGPAVSINIAAVLIVAGMLLGTLAPATAPVAGGIVVVGVLNLILGAISLVPAMPLDGGRVVRAVAWGRTGDRDQATRLTARVGRMVGWTIMGVGIALALAEFVTEGLIAIALGWLLNTGRQDGGATPGAGAAPARAQGRGGDAARRAVRRTRPHDRHVRGPLRRPGRGDRDAGGRRRHGRRRARSQAAASARATPVRGDAGATR